jgi:hypothetical protein
LALATRTRVVDCAGTGFAGFRYAGSWNDYFVICKTGFEQSLSQCEVHVIASTCFDATWTNELTRVKRKKLKTSKQASTISNHFRCR